MDSLVFGAENRIAAGIARARVISGGVETSGFAIDADMTRHLFVFGAKNGIASGVAFAGVVSGWVIGPGFAINAGMTSHPLVFVTKNGLAIFAIARVAWFASTGRVCAL